MRPQKLCKLKQGLALGAFDGFVDTWNWIVDFVANLKGEGEIDNSKSLVVDRTVDDHPVIRGGGGGSRGGGNYIAGDDTNIVFTPYGDKIKVDVYYV